MAGDIPSQIGQGVSAAEQMKYLSQAADLKEARKETAQQALTESNLKNTFEETANPLVAAFKKQQKPSEDFKLQMKKTELMKLEKQLIPIEEAEEFANELAGKNPEFKKETLMLLMERIKDVKSEEELLQLLEQFYPDATLADEALDFLLKVTTGNLKEIVQKAKDSHQQTHGREIRAGQNIAEEVQRYAKAGLDMPTNLRDMYRDITGNPREPLQLFQELSSKFAYKELRKVLAFLFHSLGADLKSGGPSIPPGYLHRLLSGIRSLQGILGLYQFFKARMKLVGFLFEREGLDVPKKLNFESMAKEFVRLIQERYPTGDKVMSSAKRLGIDEWILAKIIVFSQLRDAIRQIAISQFYRNVEHRDELYRAILEALENLEEELEELQEQEEEEYEREQLGEEEEEEEEGDAS